MVNPWVNKRAVTHQVHAARPVYKRRDWTYLSMQVCLVSLALFIGVITGLVLINLLPSG